jgi:lipoprotein-releasing system permease protein
MIRISIAAVALSVAVMITASSFINGFQYEIRSKIFAFWAHLHVQPYSLSDTYESKGVYVHQAFYEHPSLPSVRHIQSTAVKAGLLKSKDEFEGIVLKGAGLDFDWSVFAPYLKRGSLLSSDSDMRTKEILISATTATRLQLDTGDKVIVHFIGEEMRARAFRVRGIYETGIEEFDAQTALIDIRVIQDLNHWGRDTVGGFDIYLQDEQLFKSRNRAYFLALAGPLISPERYAELNLDPLDRVATSINYAIDNDQLEVRSIREMKPGLFDWLDLQTMNELIILLLMVAVAIINMITTLLILILDRTRMIGLLKALGSDDVAVRHIFLLYAASIIGIGLLIGNVVGIGLCSLQAYTHWIKLPQESYYLSYAPVRFNWLWIVSVNIGTIVTCVLLLIIPSSLISRISPVKAIRFK